jgi:hypothetical protein
MNMNRLFLARLIRVISIAAGLVIMYQALPFITDQTQLPFQLLNAPIRDDAWMYIEVPIYYLLGITFWVFAGSLIIYAGMIIARNVGAGSKAYVAELMPTEQNMKNGDFMRSDIKVEQRIQDIVNFERPIQDFLGWVLSLDKNGFITVLEHAGHQSSNHHEEDWIDFQQDKLAFLWGRTPEFYGFWSKGKWSN